MRITRRELLIFSSGLSLTGVAGATHLAGTTTANGKLRTMLLISRAWAETENIKPTAYLQKHGLGTLNKADIEAAIEKDYKHRRTIEIEGMILSKTECALVASALTEGSFQSNVT